MDRYDELVEQRRQEAEQQRTAEVAAGIRRPAVPLRNVHGAAGVDMISNAQFG